VRVEDKKWLGQGRKCEA